MLYLIPIFLIFCILFLYKKYKSRIQQILILWKLTKNLNIKSPDDFSVKNEEVGKFQIHESDKVGSVTFSKDNKLSKIHFPINLTHSIYMSDFKVEVIFDNKPPLDITQEPGIPYFVSPYDFNGISIRVINNLTGNTKYYFNSPMYCTEVYDIE